MVTSRLPTQSLAGLAFSTVQRLLTARRTRIGELQTALEHQRSLFDGVYARARKAERERDDLRLELTATKAQHAAARAQWESAARNAVIGAQRYDAEIERLNDRIDEARDFLTTMLSPTNGVEYVAAEERARAWMRAGDEEVAR